MYIFQKSTAGSVSVLFPDAQIGTKNPLEGETKVRIPNGDIRFRLNEKDIGTEHVYFAASRTPLTTLDAALARVREGQVTTLGGDKLLAGFGTMQLPSGGTKCRGLELDVINQGGCTRTRGLELDVSAGFGKGSSVGAVTEPGDSLIVYQFTFEHTTTEGYAAASRRFQAQPAARTRGGMVLERDGGMVLEKNKPGEPATRGGMVLEKDKQEEPTRRGMVLE